MTAKFIKGISAFGEKSEFGRGESSRAASLPETGDQGTRKFRERGVRVWDSRDWMQPDFDESGGKLDEPGMACGRHASRERAGCELRLQGEKPL